MSLGLSAVVLSGKGGTAKTLWQMMLAGEASLMGVATLLVDADPERNLSNHFGVSRHSTGLGSVLEEAGGGFWGTVTLVGRRRLPRQLVSVTRCDACDSSPPPRCSHRSPG